MIGLRHHVTRGTIALWLAWCVAPVAVRAIEPDFLMDSDPKLEIPEPLRNFNPALRTLWFAALERPEIDMQRMAAETIARAHDFGIPDLQDAVPRLEQILELEASHPSARFAAARALIVLQSQTSGEKLWNAAQRNGADLRQLIEPAIADWNLPQAKDAWIARLDAPKSRHRDLVLALRGLARCQEPAALPRLLSLATDPLRNPQIRLEAAVAAGQAATSGLDSVAARLVQDESSGSINSLTAIRLLGRHDDDAARQLLIQLAGHDEPAVATAALARLSEIDLALVIPLAESAMKSADAEIRWQGAAAYLQHPTAERIRSLAHLLADPHPEVRGKVGEELYQLRQQQELVASIQQAGTEILVGDRWQGQEQAALLLGALEYQPAANRLVELLESPRQEVLVAAAWALRKVAVIDTVPAMIQQATRQTELRKKGASAGLDEQVAHLFEAFGVLKADAAMPLLTQYVPKQPVLGARSRSAAIWAIGRIKEGTRDTELEDAFSDRIADFEDKPQELESVKAMSAVALTRMKAVEQARFMKGIASTGSLPLQLVVALRWAVKELTGEELPPPEPMTASQGIWFLEPLPE